MAEPKTKPTAVDVEDFIESFCHTESRKKDARQLVHWMKTWTGYPPVMWGPSIIGFGKYHYQSDRSKQEGDSPLVGFSPRKAAISLYVFSGSPQLMPLVEALGKYTMGKACIYVKKLDDVDELALKQLVMASIADTRMRYPE